MCRNEIILSGISWRNNDIFEMSTFLLPSPTFVQFLVLHSISDLQLSQNYIFDQILTLPNILLLQQQIFNTNLSHLISISRRKKLAPLWTWRSIRFRIAFMLAVALSVEGFMRSNINMASFNCFLFFQSTTPRFMPSGV
jgi:hypothetical protein